MAIETQVLVYDANYFPIVGGSGTAYKVGDAVDPWTSDDPASFTYSSEISKMAAYVSLPFPSQLHDDYPLVEATITAEVKMTGGTGDNRVAFDIVREEIDGTYLIGRFSNNGATSWNSGGLVGAGNAVETLTGSWGTFPSLGPDLQPLRDVLLHPSIYLQHQRLGGGDVTVYQVQVAVSYEVPDPPVQESALKGNRVRSHRHFLGRN